MLSTKNTSVTAVALLLSLGIAPKFIHNSLVLSPVLAQSSQTGTTFEAPKSVPEGTKVQIDGSQSMTAIDKILKQGFEKQFPNTEVNTKYEGTDTALKSVREGTIDVAAIGRPLSAEEKAQGLRAVSLKRHKIAILVGADNPFKGSININQFAKIFRGEITDWSELGGAPGAIKLIDRPETNETRQAFKNYPVFKNEPFQTGANAVKVSKDDIQEAIDKLGKDGITYVLANRVTEFPGARILRMHQTTPDDPKYPFSQALYYVYNSNKPSDSAKAFLGYATQPDTQQALNSQLLTGIAGLAGNVVANKIATPGTDTKTAQTPDTATTGNATPGTDTKTAQTPDTATTGNATPGTDTKTAQSPDTATTGTTPGTDTKTVQTPDAATIGSATPGTDTKTAQSPDTATTGTTPGTDTKTAQTPDTATTGTTPGTDTKTAQTPDAATTGTTPETDTKTAQSPDAATTGSATPGTDPKTAQAPDATKTDNSTDTAFLPNTGTNTETNPAGGGLPGWLLPLGLVLGAAGIGGWWLKSRSGSRSSTLEDIDAEPRGGVIPDAPDVTTSTSTSNLNVEPRSGVIPDAPDVTTSTSPNNLNVEPRGGVIPDAPDVTTSTSDESDIAMPFTPSVSPVVAGAAGLVGAAAGSKQKSRAILVPRDDKNAYAYWEISEQEQEELKRQGGQKMALRLYDATNLDIGNEQPQLLRQYDCDESTQDLQILIPASDRDYSVELGYTTDDNRWLSLAKSAPVRIMPTITDSELTRSNSTEPGNNIGGAAVAGAAGIAGAAAAAPAFISENPTKLQEDNNTKLQSEGFVSENPTKLQEDNSTKLQPEIFSSEAPTNLQTSDTRLQPEARIVITPRDSQYIYAYWEIPEQLKQASKQQGAEQLVLRLYDVTNIDLDRQPAHSMQEYTCDDLMQDRHLKVQQSDRDYLVELGYIASDGDWLSLARSTHVRVANDAPNISDPDVTLTSANPSTSNTTDNKSSPSNLIGRADNLGQATVAGAAGLAGAATQPFVSENTTKLQGNSTNNSSRIILVPGSSQNAYAFWEIDEQQREELKRQGGEKLIVRLYDVTNTNLTKQNAPVIEQYECDEFSQDLHLSLPSGDRNYQVEIGYLTSAQRWLGLAESASIRVIS
jgi:phosphate transport system substrate-binding protein